jgi:hypothetical protein
MVVVQLYLYYQCYFIISEKRRAEQYALTVIQHPLNANRFGETIKQV